MNDIELIVGHLERTLSAQNGVFDPTEAFLAALNGSFLSDHLQAVATRAVERQKRVGQKSDYSANPHLDNPAIVFSQGESLLESASNTPAYGELNLRSSNSRSSYLTATSNAFCLCALSGLQISIYEIVDLPDLDFYSPTSSAYLQLREQIDLRAGQTYVRSDPAFLVDVDSTLEKYLFYSHSNANRSYGLIFGRKSLRLEATGCFDPNTSKTMLYLEVLEQIDTDLARDFAFNATFHASPIVRWRALSTINKLRDDRTREILERFSTDQVTFIAKSATRILAQGPV